MKEAHTKLNLKAWAITSGIMWTLAISWIITLAIMGKGHTAFHVIDQYYLGLLSPNIKGLLIGIPLAFIDGSLFGLVFAWLYNKLAK